jgi:hypothetical protein
MSKLIINTWESNAANIVWFPEMKQVFSDGDYSSYKLVDRFYVHAYLQFGFSCLCGVNEKLIEMVKFKREPDDVIDKLLYNSAITVLNKIEILKKYIK